MNTTNTNASEPELSPHNSRTPSQTVTVVGGGLAGLSAAVEVIDRAYAKLEYQFKLVSTELGVGGASDVIKMLKQMNDKQRTELINGIPGLRKTLDLLYNLRVNIIDKESKLGGNSAKASSGINSAESQRQRDWEELYSISPADTTTQFIYDTTRSSISPEPPLWVPVSHEISQSSESDKPVDLQDFLTPLSAFTPSLISHIASTSRDAIPFLETKDESTRIASTLKEFLSALDVPLKQIHYAPMRVNGKPYNPPPPLSLSKLTQLGGHTNQRTHRPGPFDLNKPSKLPELPVGVAVISELQHRLTTYPYNCHVQVITGAQVIELTHAQEDGRDDSDGGDSARHVTGLVYKVLPNYTPPVSYETDILPGMLSAHDVETDNGKHYNLFSDHIVITTGGYSASPDLIAKHAPELGQLSLPTTNGPWATGDALSFTQSVQPGVVGLSALQVHPTSFMNPKDPHAKVNFLAPEALRGVGGILINASAQRFVNELGTRDHVSRAIYWQPNHFAYIILPAPAAQEFGGAIYFYASRGIVSRTSDSVEDFTNNLKQYLGEDISPLATIVTTLINFVKGQGLVKDSESQTMINIGETSLPLNIATSLQIALTLIGLGNSLPPVDVSSSIQLEPVALSPLAAKLLNMTANVLHTMYSYGNIPTDIVHSRPVKPHYGAFVPSHHSEEPKLDTFFIAMVTPAIHYSMGGIACDQYGRVITDNYYHQSKQTFIDYVQQHGDPSHLNPHSPDFVTHYTSLFTNFHRSNTITHDLPESSYISGLYVAGEASGGFHGRNRLGGNSLLECVAMGRTSANHILSSLLK